MQVTKSNYYFNPHSLQAGVWARMESKPTVTTAHISCRQLNLTMGMYADQCQETVKYSFCDSLGLLAEVAAAP